MDNLKENGKYAHTETQKNVIWFFDKFCCSDKLILINQQTENTLLRILDDFVEFEDFTYLLKLFRNISSSHKFKNAAFPFS